MSLRAFRNAKSMSQADLAEAAGVDQTTISTIEVGKNQNPSWETVVRLARALGVAPEDLFPIPDAANGTPSPRGAA